jgi:hypothetical protein
VEFRRVCGPLAAPARTATAFVESLSMRPPEAWTELDARAATDLATRVLHQDLAYGASVMSLDVATALARRFLDFFGDQAAFVTNGTFGANGSGGSWASLTDATFDTGVVAVSAGRVGLLWVEDED